MQLFNLANAGTVPSPDLPGTKNRGSKGPLPLELGKEVLELGQLSSVEVGLGKGCGKGWQEQ